ncbi:MAG: peptidase S8 [Marinilabiliales bacterium]|nr:MAG: peptidase S8 [Marinilabiliales bacterium]
MKPKRTVIVAVIDSGIDIMHEDLEGQIWTNDDEIPDNNIDDDDNGYTDDVHGWNFIGNANGENVNYENYEYTRIVKKSEESDYLSKAKEQYNKELKYREDNIKGFKNFEKSYYSAKELILKETGVEVNSLEDLKKVDSKNENVLNAKNFLLEKYSLGFTEEALEEVLEMNQEYLDYYLNLDFNPREIVGDDPNDFDDRNYGNNDVIGPSYDHGTSTAGVIAAVRGNGIGIDGIATDVEIMTLRVVPDGDERDKDIAIAIIYAVDNGANIINMSFGKQYSPNKEFVDFAVKYAQDHNVLLVHSAGNYGVDLDLYPSYPSDRLNDNTELKNWISVGASSIEIDKYFVGIFSNYGKEYVDIYSPGVDVISLYGDSRYRGSSGTSIAGPIVSGIAALIWSYYPDLTASEMVTILKESSYKPKKNLKVLKPDLENEKRKKVKFSELSESGGIVNAYEAFKLAGEYK